MRHLQKIVEVCAFTVVAPLVMLVAFVALAGAALGVLVRVISDMWHDV